MKAAPSWLPRLSAGQLLAVAVIAFLALSAFVDVVTSFGSIGKNSGAPRAQLGGVLGGVQMTVGQESHLAFGLYVASGSAMSPACIGANLTPEFRVVKVTFLGSEGTRWKDGESCGGILETNSTIPVVISVVPLHPGDYGLEVEPKVLKRTVGDVVRADILVRS
ncbi:MAG: hypothetical protein ACYDC5_10835 [Candidatus Dormibacteria bacterium]